MVSRDVADSRLLWFDRGDAQDHAAALAATVDVAVRLDDLIEFICPVDHRS